MKRTALEVWSTEEPRTLRARSTNTSSRRPLSELDSSRCHAPVFGLDFFEQLQRSRITFNCHRDAARGGVDNQRLFQATGVGACLITDRAADLPELFEDGTEVVTYDCMDDCVEKVEYLLEHEDERRAIAAAGHRRTLADHSGRKRYAAIDEIIQQALAKNRKELRTAWRGFSGSASF
ncbi:MAG: glycosyltransferase family 1 protein [Deltaproteobacteria bacterium]|nr:glycosyltransferase family 1 protein [Deltaproteobacteria bacterium]